jgi:phage baseplate assembly protein W
MSHSLDIMRQAVLKQIVVVLGERTFTPNYGCAICEYKKHSGVIELIVPDNLLD